MSFFRPESEGTLKLATLPEDFAPQVEERGNQGLFVTGNRRRANYVVRRRTLDDVRFGAADGFGHRFDRAELHRNEAAACLLGLADFDEVRCGRDGHRVGRPQVGGAIGGYASRPAIGVRERHRAWRMGAADANVLGPAGLGQAGDVDFMTPVARGYRDADRGNSRELRAQQDVGLRPIPGLEKPPMCHAFDGRTW